MKEKTCVSCRRRKPVWAFGRSRSAHDGLLAICRACVKDLRKVKV